MSRPEETTDAAGSVDRVLVVANPSARGGATELVDEIESLCRGLGCEPTVLMPDGVSRAVAVIRDAIEADGPWRAVLAVGGDGTARTCAEALSGTDTPMVLVPAGTGNSMYRALWEDRPWPETLSVSLGDAARGSFVGRGAPGVRDIDLLAVKGGDSGMEVVALLGVSTGLVAEVLRASEDLAEVSGRERYSAAIGPALGGHRPFAVRVTLDDEVLVGGPVSLIAVGGARHRAGTFALLPRSVLDDGLLDVCVIGGVDAAGFVELAGAVVAGEHLDHPLVTYAQGHSVRIERTDGEPLMFEHDGDLWPEQERSVEVTVAGSVRVFAPVDPVAG